MVEKFIKSVTCSELLNITGEILCGSLCNSEDCVVFFKCLFYFNIINMKKKLLKGRSKCTVTAF